MKISSDGKIAYHSIRFRPDGLGTDFVQYDFDGSIEYIKEFYTDYRSDLLKIKCNNY